MLIKTRTIAPSAALTAAATPRTTAWYGMPTAGEVSFKRSRKPLGNHDGWPPGPRNSSSG